MASAAPATVPGAAIATHAFGNMTLTLHAKDVWLLTMTAGDNRVNGEFIKSWNSALDVIAASRGAAALVVTGNGNFFSNGLDLEWMATQTPDGNEKHLENFERLMARMMTFGCPTIAAINGHAFAGGCMMALALDYRVMRSDRGFLSLPEIDLNLPLRPGMNAICSAKVTDSSVFRDMILTAARIPANDAVAKKLVDSACDSKSLLPTAFAMAAKLAPKGANRSTMETLKREAYAPAYRIAMRLPFDAPVAAIAPFAAPRAKL